MTKQQQAFDAMLNQFDKAVEAELSKVSTLEYNSHEICKYFAEKIRAALTAAKEKHMPDLVQRLRDTASKGVSVWGGLQMEAAKEIEILTAEREAYASAMDRMKAKIAAMESQVSKAAMKHGLTLIKNAEGYDIVNIGKIIAQSAPGAAPKEAKQLTALHNAALGVNRKLAVDAERYQYLRNHFARAILGAAFSYHATDTGEADLDRVIDNQLDVQEGA